MNKIIFSSTVVEQGKEVLFSKVTLFIHGLVPELAR